MHEGKLAQKAIWSKLSRICNFLAILYLALNIVVFVIFAPLKTTVVGVRISFSDLNNPVKNSLALFLLGLLFSSLAKRPSGFTQRSLLSFIFCAVFLIHLSSGVMTSFDSRWTIPTTRSIIREGNTDLDEYREIIEHGDYRVEEIGGHLYSIFPIGVSVVALPLIWVFNDQVIMNSYPDIERMMASLFMAVASIFIYLISFLSLGNRKLSMFLVFIFAFCTSVWSTASRALWQQGPSLLMLTIALYLILLARIRPNLIQFVSIPLVFAYMIRPTNSISVLFLTIFVFFHYRQYFSRYLLWTLFLVLPFLFYNLSVYDSILSTYYLPQRIGALANFIQALVGNLISPSRGLFVYSPVFLLSIFGFWIKVKNKKSEKLDYYLLGIIAFHWITISSFAHWWAGHSYGPRFFADMIPYLIYFMIPAMAEMFRLRGALKTIYVAIFVCLMAMSFFVHMRGTTTQDVYDWNNYPVDVDLKPERVWDWTDVQFMRGL
jgi:hypothetical protein